MKTTTPGPRLPSPPQSSQSAAGSGNVASPAALDGRRRHHCRRWPAIASSASSSPRERAPAAPGWNR
eukprot:11224031-Lingulodinium_polyedra.AAC.1